jgi:energy-coupling factor transporter ATP-binding protein EcfA2
MALYEVTFEAEVCVTVEAGGEKEAEQKARTIFRWTDVHLLYAWDIVNLSDGEDRNEHQNLGSVANSVETIE